MPTVPSKYPQYRFETATRTSHPLMTAVLEDAFIRFGAEAFPKVAWI